MNRERAIAAYQRVAAWERRQSELLRQRILIPVFGGCLCRLHNCLVNWESGFLECEPARHREQARLSREYTGLQRRIWDTANRLQAAFARSF